MSFDYSCKITRDEMREIFARLQPYLPKYLKPVDTTPYGLRFTFVPFTGQEPEPRKPSTFKDPKLRYVPGSDDAAEQLLRAKACDILTTLYDKAQEEWRDAAYVADLTRVVGDALAHWETYQAALKALNTAYAYLRTPDAAKEWRSAISRLIDAQDETRRAAVRFDERAQRIAEIHDRHLYADLSRAAALNAAGYPEAQGWHITELRQYSKNCFSNREDDGTVPLEEQVRRLIERQDAHIAKVGRLSGAAATGTT
ncbi:hypothetical protein [Streptomyces sp. NPDC004296]|uniref:hypothetical protein n=1 Tax=Streptomyces sp. NPDC004296 TaxID=3364697 RepID=UPI00369203DC